MRDARDALQACYKHVPRGEGDILAFEIELGISDSGVSASGSETFQRHELGSVTKA